jgi:hypothetical protein
MENPLSMSPSCFPNGRPWIEVHDFDLKLRVQFFHYICILNYTLLNTRKTANILIYLTLLVVQDCQSSIRKSFGGGADYGKCPTLRNFKKLAIFVQ